MADPYQVLLSASAERTLKAIESKTDRRRIDAVLAVLDTVPEIGRNYDPLYEAARPSEPVLVFYAGNYGLYYQIDKPRHAVKVLFIEDQRRDPLARFSPS